MPGCSIHYWTEALSLYNCCIIYFSLNFCWFCYLYLNVLLLGAYMLMIVFSWWTDPFITMKCPTLSLVTCSCFFACLIFFVRKWTFYTIFCSISGNGTAPGLSIFISLFTFTFTGWTILVSLRLPLWCEASHCLLGNTALGMHTVTLGCPWFPSDLLSLFLSLPSTSY